jgi:hypothetical protein
MKQPKPFCLWVIDAFADEPGPLGVLARAVYCNRKDFKKGWSARRTWAGFRILRHLGVLDVPNIALEVAWEEYELYKKRIREENRRAEITPRGS